MWDDDHGEELSQCSSAVELTQWCDILLLRTLTTYRLNTRYPARRETLTVTDESVALAQHMLRVDYAQRPTARVCLKSTYFSGISTTVATDDKENLGVTVQKRRLNSAIAMAPVAK